MGLVVGAARWVGGGVLVQTLRKTKGEKRGGKRGERVSYISYVMSMTREYLIF